MKTLNLTEVLEETVANQPHFMIDNYQPLLDDELTIDNLMTPQAHVLLDIIAYQSPPHRKINLEFFDDFKRAERILKQSIANN